LAEVTVLPDDTGLESETLEGLLEGIVGDGVEVVVTDPGHMRVLNRTYRHIDRTTDVLSFDLSLPDGTGGGPEGTIFVDGRLHPPLEALLERIFHGYLHLAGMSHDTEEGSEKMALEVGRLVELAMKGRNAPC